MGQIKISKQEAKELFSEDGLKQFEKVCSLKKIDINSCDYTLNYAVLIKALSFNDILNGNTNTTKKDKFEGYKISLQVKSKKKSHIMSFDTVPELFKTKFNEQLESLSTRHQKDNRTTEELIKELSKYPGFVVLKKNEN